MFPFSELIELCREYSDLGGPVQEQLDSFLEGSRDHDSFNINALRLIRDFLAMCAPLSVLRQCDQLIEEIENSGE